MDEMMMILHDITLNKSSFCIFSINRKRMEKDGKGWKRMEKDGKGWKRMEKDD